MLLAGDSFDTGMNPEAWTMPACEPSAEVCVPTGEWDYPHDLGSIATANVQAEEEARRQAEMQAEMEAYASMAAATASVDVSLGMAASGLSDGFPSEYATTDPMASMSFDAAAYATGAVPLPSSPSPSSGEASTAPAQAPAQASDDSAQAAIQSPGSSGPTLSTQTRTDEGPWSGSTTIIVTGEGYRSSTVSFWINQSGYRETSTSLSEEWWSEGFYRSTTLTSGTKTSSTTETQSWSTDERGATRSGNSTRTDTRTETWEYSFSFEGPSRGVGAYSSRQSTTVVSDSSWTSSGDSTDPLPGGTSSGSHDSSGSDSSTRTHVITTVGETYSWSDTTQVITESGFGAASSTAKAGSSYDDASISATGLAWYSGGSQSDAFASSSYTYATSMRQRSQVFSDGTESHAPWVCDGSQTVLVFERDGGTWWASSTRHSLTPTSLSSRDRDSKGSDSTVYVGVFRSKRDTSGFWSTTGTGTVITSADSSSRYRGGETSGSPGDGTGSSMSFDDKDTSSSSSNIVYAYDDINGWLATSGSMTSSGSGTGTFTWSESDLEESGTTTNGFRSSAKSGGTDNTRYGYTKTSTKSNGGSWKTTGSGSRGGDGSSGSSYDERVAVESAGGKASESADGYDESEYEWSATYTYSDPKPVDPYGYDPSAYDSSGSDAGGWRAVSGTGSSSASGAHNSSWSVSSESSTGLGPLQLSAKFNGSGRQTSAYGEWTSSTIGDSGTWVTTGTGVSTDSSTLSLSFSGGVTLGEGGPGVSVSGSHDRASRSTAATAYDDAKGWHTTSGSRSQSGSGGGNVGTTAGYGIVGGSGAGFSYEFSLNSTSGPTGASTTSGSASATLSWSGTGDTGQTGSGITARARYDDGEGWQVVSVGPATTAGPEGVPGAGDLGTATAGDDATFSGDESSRQGQAAANGKGGTAAGDVQGQATSSTLDRVQLGLDVLGLVPVLGEAFDGLNGLISWGRGDYSGAALSFAGMFPVGGQAATAAKLGLKYGDDVAAVAAKAGARVTGDALAAARKQFNALKPQAWIDEAAINANRYTPEQLVRMRRGQAPIGADGFPMEIHHRIPLSEGGVNAMNNYDFMTRTEHRLGANYKKHHPNCP